MGGNFWKISLVVDDKMMWMDHKRILINKGTYVNFIIGLGNAARGYCENHGASKRKNIFN